MIAIIIYTNGTTACYYNGDYYSINSLGELTICSSGNMLKYHPNPQSGNCIVGAISNLMWHYGKNGYPSLISNMTFKSVEDSVDAIIMAQGGYANKYIPKTISNYVKSKSTKYTVSVKNKQNPTFNNVKNEVENRPCLLGFAAGSSYSKTVGHMTVCVGTLKVSGTNYVKVMDGWSSEIVQKKWGSYNDFMSKVVISK